MKLITDINHVKVDADSKFITDYATTSANIHDSNEFSEFLGEADKVIYADSAYVGIEIPKHVENRICEKGYRGKPLTDEQKESNRRKSKIRCRIEHDAELSMCLDLLPYLCMVILCVPLA